MKLNLLIPTTPDRDHYMVNLTAEIRRQVDESNLWPYVEIVTKYDNFENTVGWKRNYLLDKADGEYLAFIDSDDRISEDYLKLAFEGINKGVDCCSLTGIITENGKNPKMFIHSILYDSWFEKDGVYYRNTNHLNVVKSSIAKQMRFPESKHKHGDGNHGEDRSYSEQLLQSGLLKTEHFINAVTYFYDWRQK
jgi:glycosyltransferase involved in cell wall biosynthesis